MSRLKKVRPDCPVCNKVVARVQYKYCSNVCQQEYQHEIFIKQWKSGMVTGLRNIGVVSKHIKRYLRQKFSNKCCLCGWSQLNKYTNVVPLVADHIDGDWFNNKENNLRLLCPNCDALTATFAALNKGRGRPNRAPSRRAQVRGTLV